MFAKNKCWVSNFCVNILENNVWLKIVEFKGNRKYFGLWSLVTWLSNIYIQNVWKFHVVYVFDQIKTIINSFFFVEMHYLFPKFYNFMIYWCYWLLFCKCMIQLKKKKNSKVKYWENWLLNILTYRISFYHIKNWFIPGFYQI